MVWMCQNLVDGVDFQVVIVTLNIFLHNVLVNFLEKPSYSRQPKKRKTYQQASNFFKLSLIILMSMIILIIIIVLMITIILII